MMAPAIPDPCPPDATGAWEPGPTVGQVLAAFVTRPGTTLLRRWNWKSAVLSSSSRSLIFLVANLSAGTTAAVRAFATELAYRGLTAGFYGAMTEAFRHATPRRQATVVAMVVIPGVAHVLEATVHWLQGTPNLGVSVAASLSMTGVTTLFNLFAMRRGALIVGEGRQSLVHDLIRMPALGGAFVRAIVRELGSLVALPARRQAVARLTRVAPTAPTASEPGRQTTDAIAACDV